MVSEVRPEGRQSGAVAALDAIIEFLLVALLAFCPLALGAVEAWSEGAAFGIGATLAVLVAIRTALSPERESRGWVYLPVLGYLTLAGLQLISVPDHFLGLISSNTVAVRKDLLGDLPNAGSVLGNMTASLYPQGTKHDLRLVLLAGSVLFTVMTVFRTPRRIRRLMVWVALIGGMIGGLALAQDLTHTTAIYWRIPIVHPPYSGPFVNHNHFAQFLNLAMGAALGLLLASLHKNGAGNRRVAWWTIPILLCGAVTIAFSMSRGGLMSMLVAGLVLLVMLARRGSFWHVGAVVLTVAILGFAGVLSMGIDRISESMRAATTPQGYGMRLRMDRDALRIWRDFPVLGIGLGAHEWVFPGYERQIAINVATHVENEYLQTLEEMGLAGFACVTAFLAIVIVCWLKGSRNTDPALSGRALGLGYGLVAVMAHSLTDYGQHVPAVVCMSAVVCGLLVNLGWKSRPSAERSPLRGAAACGLVTACGVVGAWICIASWATHRGAMEWNRAEEIGDRLAATDWKGTDPAYDELLARAGAAIRWQPENVMYRYRDGAYRWRAVTRRRNAEGNAQLEGKNLVQARQIIADLNQARRLCPTFGLIYWYVGQKERIFGEAIGDKHILTSARLAPNDPTANFLAGRVHAERGRWDEAAARFRRALALDRSLLRDVIDEYLVHHEGERLVNFFPDSWKQTVDLSVPLSAVPGQKDLAERVYARGIAMLQPLADRPDADFNMLIYLGVHYFGRGGYAEADRYFGRALQFDYGNVEFRFLRARALEQLHRLPEARNEALTVLRLDPRHNGAKDLLKMIAKQQEK